MPTLLNRAKELRDLASRLAVADIDRSRFGQLTTRTSQIQEARVHLWEAQKVLRLLDARELRPPSLPRPSGALKRKAPALDAKLAEDWRAFIDDRSLPTNFVEPVKAHAAKLREAALAAWQAHVDEGLPSIREALITALASAGFKPQCTRLQQLQDQVMTVRRSCPSSVADFHRLDELKAAIQAVWSELEGVPADVTAFLRKAAQREATISDLTPGIRAWLDDREMLGQLRIGLG
jgi:hypothetical protein